MAGEERDPETLAYLREKYRLNDPIPMQYFTWVGNALTGDLGISLRTNQPVLELIAQKLPVTIQLASWRWSSRSSSAFRPASCRRSRRAR